MNLNRTVVAIAFLMLYVQCICDVGDNIVCFSRDDHSIVLHFLKNWSVITLLLFVLVICNTIARSCLCLTYKVTLSLIITTIIAEIYI